MQRFGFCFSICIALGAAAIGSAQGYPITLSGTAENYMVAGSQRRGVQHRQTWNQLAADIGDHLRLVIGNQQKDDENYADETYAQFECKGNLVRAGLIRTPFGFSSR